MLLHQPQVTSWGKFTTLAALVAADYSPKGSRDKALGVVAISAKTVADKQDGTVVLYDIEVVNLNFSTLDRSQLADAALQVGKLLPTAPVTMSLEQVTTSLAGYEQAQETQGLQSEAPPVFVETVAAMLVQSNSKGVTANVERTEGLSFVINTNWDIVKTDKPAAYYLRDDTAWLTADDLSGPWRPVEALPDIFKDLPKNDNWKATRAAVPAQPLKGAPPLVVYSDKPAELISIDGKPELQGIADTDLQWVSNTHSDLFFLTRDNSWYFLTSGRWFHAATLQGPWTFATPDLPAEFF